jgi:NAD+ diphosphatase
MIPFTGNPLNRASEKRTDSAWVDAKRRDATSLIMPMWRLQPFLIGEQKSGQASELGMFRPGLCESMASPDAPSVFLGLEGDRALFALDVSAANDPENSGPLAGFGRFTEARASAMALPMKDAAIMGQAKAMIDWHNRHGFCPNCGVRTQLTDAGYRRHCDACGADHFPRTDPVVIMLPVIGERCLLGRQAAWPKGMYSALAGFLEPGESIEEACARELFEEAAVRTVKVRYHSTQPWPYPSSLMIGLIAEIEEGEPVADNIEIDEVRWFSRDDARALIRGDLASARAPGGLAIAHQLIKAWAEEG